jgi:hypothetical protein
VLSRCASEVTGCSTQPCTQRLTLGGAFVTKVTLGSPSLTDRTEFEYATMSWDRTEGRDTKSFTWDVTLNTP